MEIRRVARKAGYTIGRLMVDGVRFCDTLEDTDRGLSRDMGVDEIRRLKVPGATAIPTGRYRVTLGVRSPRFGSRPQYAFCGGRLPRLLGVPGYDGVLVHAGNTAADTEWCILVGENRVAGKVLDSASTFRQLYGEMERAGGDIWLTVK